jgi:hypothetical protein
VLIWITAIRLLFALRDRGSVLMAHALATDTAAGITGAEPVPPAPVPPAPVPPAPVPPGEALSPDVPRR